MKHILDYKERQIVAACNSRATNVHTLYNSLSGRDRALMRAGAWMQASTSLYEVQEPGLRNSEAVADFVRPFYADIAGQEEIVFVLLDNKNKPICVESFTGVEAPASATLDLRKLLKAVLVNNCSSVIVTHNHPSGETSASAEDIRMTRDLAGLLKNISVELLDHIILTPRSHCRVSWA